jgi:hypothetical protein
MTENFKELAMKVLAVLARRDDEHALEFGEGEPWITAKTGFRDVRNFAGKHMAEVCSRTTVARGVESLHTPFGHYWKVGRWCFTHPSSAEAWGACIREHHRAMRREQVPGWYGPRSCPVSSGSAVADPIGTTSE